MMRPIALTMGDPAGIAGEITVAAWRALQGELSFFAIADPGWLASLGAPVVEITAPEEAVAGMGEGLPVLAERLASEPRPGEPDAANAPAILRAIDRAVALALENRVGAICTNPVSKRALREGAGFAFQGHTDYLGHLAGTPRPVMMLAGPGLRVVPVTVHVPLAEVPQLLTAELLEETLRITDAALKRDFGIEAPRLAVAGLNPHAGEGGVIGQEEATIIAPVLARLRQEGMEVTGPHSPDSLFHPPARARYDAAICMYHDQALIPLKALYFDEGVNVTLGLPFVRTSPDHGTAFDIAGRGLARAESLIAALRLAREIGRARG
ncbi:MAG TPA: 4-hydroxythreonine-4-phosphate dehydrogenase PdxA [Paracoccaceae bacterium]|nr:4-hydroxythreonine-4-phosphate dehydrogenase PdxA [Paracoccaceae bacterium]